MIFGIGTDIIEVKRMEKHLEGNDALRQKLFTKAEQIYSEKGKVTVWQRYAARFAAKEAVMKVLGTGWSNGVNWTDIEVFTESSGKPYITLYGKTEEKAQELGITTIHNGKKMAVLFYRRAGSNPVG